MILQKVRTMLLGIERDLSAGSTRAAARLNMARALSVGPGTLENLIRPDRVKTVSADLAAKIKALWVKTIEAKMARLEHELELAHQLDLDISPPDLEATETLLAEARALLRKGGAR